MPLLYGMESAIRGKSDDSISLSSGQGHTEFLSKGMQRIPSRAKRLVGKDLPPVSP